MRKRVAKKEALEQIKKKHELLNVAQKK